MEQRHERWECGAGRGHGPAHRGLHAELYTPEKYAFRKSGSGRLVASTHLAAPGPQTIDRGDAAETDVVVSVKT